MFPVIRNIQDVFKEHDEADLKERGFIVMYKDTYTVIDYVVSKENTFETPMLRELRGIKFDAVSGDIISRPLHKFFNIGESRCSILSIEGCQYFEKLDGSMVATANGALMTRKGFSDQAMMAQEYLSNLTRVTWSRYDSMIALCAKEGLTAIFEFTSPTNRIVVKYSDTDLRLLALRDNITGTYHDYEVFARQHRIPYAQEKFLQGDIKEWVDEQENFEGLVVRDGNRFAKVKNADYVLRHRAMDGLRHEKDVLLLVVESKVDDFMGLLTDEDLKKKLQDYEWHVVNRAAQIANDVQDLVLSAVEIYETRKEMAVFIKKNLHKQLQGIAFKYLDALSKNDSEVTIGLTLMIRDAISKVCSSGTKVETARECLLKGVPQWVN